MSNTHWFCSECGDGPLLIVNNVACPNCYHPKCYLCREETIYPKYGTVDRASSNNQTVAKNADFAHDSIPALSAALPPASACCNTIDTIHHHDTSIKPVEGEIVYRWTCCACRGDNSYEYQPGCTTCNNHWRCDRGCIVYKTEV